jgi:hypothetical protein
LGVINAAILGMGLLTDKPLPYWHSAQQQIKDACVLAAKYCNVSTSIKFCSYEYRIDEKNISIIKGTRS